MFNALCLLAAAIVFAPAILHAQNDRADELIGRSLDAFDLVPFGWEGEAEPLRPRLGVYVQAIPADSFALLPGVPSGARPVRVWHVMPHWSADRAGMLAGDLIVTLNGKPIGDSAYQYDDYLNVTFRELRPGEAAQFEIVRNGVFSRLSVPAIAAVRAPLPVPPDPPGLGPVRAGSWLAKSIATLGLIERAQVIQKQLCIVADQDFCTVPFTARPSPWRLNAVTYLHHNPTRVGAYSRWLDAEMWRQSDAHGLLGAVAHAGRTLGVELPPGLELPERPNARAEFDRYLVTIGAHLGRAYAPVRRDLDTLCRSLARLLDPVVSWEVELDTTTDQKRRRELRFASEKRLSGLFASADAIDRAALTQAGIMLAALTDTAWVRAFASKLRSDGLASAGRVAGVEGDVVAQWQTPQGLCVVGGPGANRYTGDFAVVFDLGGDDVYALPAVRPGAFRYLADLGGDDVYRSSEAGQGSGIGACDVLVDLAGNDTYRSVSWSQGAGVLGIGVLADFSGDDLYDARWCSQGSAFLGIGLLYDQAGADRYGADVYSQAFGYARGFGALLDCAGNDSYRAGWKHPDSRVPNRAHLAMSQGFGYGMRPWTTGVGTDGGIGLLSDRAGDDLYASDFFSQGGSYWYALGVLHDAAGADRYTAGQYSQGSGIHLSFGALLDDSGDDMYDAYAGLEQGNAHDWSAGCLEDAAGNDTYRGSSSSQGSALNVSFAWLLDAAGDDQYYARLSDTVHSQGGGNANRLRRGGSLGMLIDLGGGDDYYVEPRAEAGRPVVKGNGILFDDGRKQ